MKLGRKRQDARWWNSLSVGSYITAGTPRPLYFVMDSGQLSLAALRHATHDLADFKGQALTSFIPCSLHAENPLISSLRASQILRRPAYRKLFIHSSSNMSTSNVGGPGVYQADDQRTSKDSENQPERFKEGKPNSHLANDASEYKSDYCAFVVD